MPRIDQRTCIRHVGCELILFGQVDKAFLLKRGIGNFPFPSIIDRFSLSSDLESEAPRFPPIFLPLSSSYSSFLSSSSLSLTIYCHKSSTPTLKKSPPLATNVLPMNVKQKRNVHKNKSLFQTLFSVKSNLTRLVLIRKLFCCLS